MNLQNGKRLTDLENELVVARRSRMREGVGRAFRMDMCARDNQQGPPAQHRTLCSALCGSLDGRGSGGDTRPCVRQTRFAVHLKLSQGC